jgi:hypothetical protein
MTDHRTLKHVCGLSGYNGMIDPPCPACEAREAAREAPADAPPATPLPNDYAQVSSTGAAEPPATPAQEAHK